MRQVKPADVPSVLDFLKLPHVQAKHNIKLDRLDWMIDQLSDKDYLGFALLSESDGKVTGFFMTTLEYADLWPGKCYWILAALGIDDETEIANNEWVRDVYFPEVEAVGATAVYKNEFKEQMEKTLVPVFGLVDSEYDLLYAKI